MAVTAREILLIFRGQNYLSSAIRKVGSDVGSLSRGQQLAHQRAQLQINERRLQTTRNIAANEYASLATGSRQLALQKAKLGLSDKEFANAQALRRNYEARLTNAINLSKIERRIASPSLAKGLFGGMNQKELEVEHQRLLHQQETLARQQVKLDEITARSSIEYKKYAASLEEASQRQAVLTQRVNASSEALELNDAKLRQNALAMKMLPTQIFSDRAAQVEHLGRVVQMFGLITTAVFGYAADQAAKFNTQVTLAATQSTLPGKNTVAQVQKNAAYIQNQIQQMLLAGRTTAQPTELTRSAYDIYSSLTLKGNQKQQLQQGLEILKEFNKVVTANYGLVDINRVTQAGVTIMNDFGVSVGHLPRELNTMQAAVRYGRITMDEFLRTFGQAAPAAKAAGYSFSQMSSSIAFLSRKFPQAQQGAVGYARLLELLSRNAQKFNQAGYQVTNKAGTQLLPLDQIVRNILDKNPQLAKGGVALQNFFKTITNQTGYIRSRQVFTFLAQDLLGYQKMVKNVTGDQNELNKSIKAAQKSPGVQWEQFKNQLRAIMLILGAGAIPAFKAFAAPIIAAVQWFDRLSPSTQRAIGYLGAMIGILTLLGGTLAAVVGGLLRVGAGLKLMFMARTASADLSLLAGEAGAVTTSAALMSGGLVLLIGSFILFHKQAMAVVDALGGLHNILTIIGLTVGAIALARVTRAMYAFATSIIVTGNSAAVAAGEVAALETTTAGLAAMSPITLTFAIVVVGGYALDKYIKWAGQGAAGSAAMTTGGVNPYNGAGPVPVGGDPNAYKSFTERQKAQWMNMYVSKGVEKYHSIKEWLAHKKELDDAIAKDYYQTALMPWQKKEITAEKALRGLTDSGSKLAKSHSAAAKAAKDYGTTATKAFTAAYNAYLKAAKAAKADPQNFEKQMALQNALTKLTQVASKQQIAAAQKVASAVTSSADSTKTTFKDVLSNVQSMYNNFLQQEQGIFGTLFQGPFMQSPFMQNQLQYGYKVQGSDLSKDLKQQIGQYTKFNKDLSKLSARGAPYQLIQQLQQLGPSALPEIRALLNMSSGNLAHYFDMFRKAKQLVEQQALRDLNSQLEQYRKYGRNIALAIVAGLKDENVAMTNAIKNMIKRMFPGLPGSGGGNRPPQPPPHHHHHNQQNHRHHHRRQSSGAGQGSTGGVVHHHYTYHVTAPPGSDIGTQVKHADFRQKHKHNRNNRTGSRYD